MLNLADVFEALLGYRPEGIDLVITEASIDSRQCIAGSLFVAIPGEKVDGHNFVGDAFHKGASIALVQKDLSNLFPNIQTLPTPSSYLQCKPSGYSILHPC